MLGGQVGAGWLAAFGFERAVHALVATVVFGVAGAGVLDFDPEAEPPDAQAAEASRGHAGEGAAVVDPDGFGQAVGLEEGLAGPLGPVLRGLRQGVDAQDVAAVQVTRGQWVAALSISQREPAFEVERPHLIDALHLAQRGVRALEDLRSAAARFDQTMPFEDLADRA